MYSFKSNKLFFLDKSVNNDKKYSKLSKSFSLEITVIVSVSSSNGSSSGIPIKKALLFSKCSYAKRSALVTTGFCSSKEYSLTFFKSVTIDSTSNLFLIKSF